MSWPPQKIPVKLRGDLVPGHEERIRRGDRVRARDAFNQWHDAIATTGVIYGDDFEIVWIRRPDSSPDDDGVPFPQEDVEFIERPSPAKSKGGTDSE